MDFKNSIRQNYILLLIIAVAAALRFYHADFQSIWLDEILSMNNSNPALSMKQFYDGIMFWEFIPHFFFLLLRAVFEIFGYSTFVGRIFSAVIGIGGVYAIYLLGRELFGRRGGLIAAAFLCVNFFHISYSQEIRPYGMLFLFSTLAFYRLAVFIRRPTLINGVYYGIFAGLILNSHFFGFITLFAQYLILLLFLIVSPATERKSYFINAFVSGIVTLILFWPAYEAFMRVSEISSFWLQKPGAEPFTQMFKEFFGNAEMVLILAQFLVLAYILRLFRENDFSLERTVIARNHNIFAFVILFVWILTSVLIPLIRSYLSVPMILNRYFINLVPALVLVIAGGAVLIKNRLIRSVAVGSFVLFSLIDILIVKDFYNTVSKTQFRELTNEIVARNPEKSKVVAYWSWLFPYFLQPANIPIEGRSLEDHVASLRSGTSSPEAFWYADANSRPFALDASAQGYLADNFVLREKLEYHDAWAHYYVPKNAATSAAKGLELKMFRKANFNAEGHMQLFENTNAVTDFIALDKGNYVLKIKGTSFPAKPINGENAHIRIRLNGNEIANFNLSEDPKAAEQEFTFVFDGEAQARFQLIYDNDVFENGQDRNAVIQSISLGKR